MEVGISGVIDKWLAEAKADLKSNYKTVMGHDSETWRNSLETTNVRDGNIIKVRILGAYYTYWLEHGRNPTTTKTAGNPTLREIIEKWILKKGIGNKDISVKSLAYIIARKIHEKGIKVPNAHNKGGIITNIINKKRIELLINMLEKSYSIEIKSDLIKEFKK